MSQPKPYCPGCKLNADEIYEYVESAADCDMDVDAYVRLEEGTYNRENGHFLCTVCYVEYGMPSGPGGWVCP